MRIRAIPSCVIVFVCLVPVAGRSQSYPTTNQGVRERADELLLKYT